mmetsp:Transcript_79981/g.248200  ORF Transcript_79981/g.248200 Transcript_79981/m.248200 type:complete len:100 (-) Transcript_79981:300-599(-)
MIMSTDLYGPWSSPTDRQKMWLSVRRYSKGYREYSDPKLPPGDFTVQEGWRFSAHKMRKYMALPYFDLLLALRVFKNGERVSLAVLPPELASRWDGAGR